MITVYFMNRDYAVMGQSDEDIVKNRAMTPVEKIILIVVYGLFGATGCYYQYKNHQKKMAHKKEFDEDAEEDRNQAKRA